MSQNDFVGSSSSGRTDAGSGFIPYGHCLANERWRDGALVPKLNQVFKVQLIEGLGCVDFQPSQKHIVMFLTETDIALGIESIQIRLARLYKYAMKKPQARLSPSVIYHRTEFTLAYTIETQQLCVIEFGIPFVPISTIDQIPQYLMSLLETAGKKNPFKGCLDERQPVDANKDALLVVMGCPGVGEAKARKLLNKFKSVRGICLASLSELEGVLGRAAAANIHNFLKLKMTD